MSSNPEPRSLALSPRRVMEGIQVKAHVCPWQPSMLPGHLKVAAAAQLDSKRLSGWSDPLIHMPCRRPLSPRCSKKHRGGEGGDGAVPFSLHSAPYQHKERAASTTCYLQNDRHAHTHTQAHTEREKYISAHTHTHRHIHRADTQTCKYTDLQLTNTQSSL